MKDFYLLEGLKVQLKMEHVLHAIDCNPDSPVYEEMVDEYLEIYKDMEAFAEPVGILGVGSLSEAAATEEYPAGTKVVYAVLSVGDKIKQCSTEAFAKGDYVRGMLCDAIADNALFSLEDKMLEKLREMCAERNVGILRRLEAPHDISMKVQKDAWEHLKLKERLGIDITCGYMLDPVKTSCQVFVLTEDKEVFRAQHDCSKCPNLNCKFRNVEDRKAVKVTVRKGDGCRDISLEKDESLMDALIREGYYISAACGGKGRCGKCKICVLEGQADISSEDRGFFSKEELEQGWRLSCMLYPRENLTISFELNDESQFEAISEYRKDKITETEATSYNDAAKDSDGLYDIAIDIGTTTLAFQLLDKAGGNVCSTVSAVNNQRRYGADVVSRMQASIDGKKAELKESIQADLRNGISRLLKESGVNLKQIDTIAIGCNTTMGHLLLGYDCRSLGVYPFTPVNIRLTEGSMSEVLGMDGDAGVVVLPGISTFVGGDIVAGLYACDFDKNDDICLLVDLGTNGEMALGNSGKIMVTSTAAGPAFEGGNISCGMGSVAGAICSVKLEGAKANVRTIKDEAPLGICGTGVVEAVSELLREELLDETGLLEEDYFEEGFPLAKTSEGKNISLTQKDIRELQLAKAAVRAGIETLILRYGIEKKQVAKIYLAGGFGYRLDTAKAIAIGMIPEEFADRIEAVGNSCLAGVVKYLTADESGAEVLKKLVQVSEEINLSMDVDFNENYMEAMMFE
ncbi:MAG: DUF4445 domain-containing protein [Lachnospiraceae bacterium]|nr:DUF4445 domain-containing protein [Lachnospiraceae bacterium]